MKVRKIKLLASLTSLLLVFVIMGVGVWAAAGQSVNIATTVTFNATGVSGTMTGTLTGVGGAIQYYNTTYDAVGLPIDYSPSLALPDWTLGAGTPLAIESADGIASDIVYTFTITNSSTTDGIILGIADLLVGTNLTITSVIQDGGAPIVGTAGDYTFTNIAASGTTTIAVTVNVTDDAVSITSADITYTINLTSVNA